MLVCRKRQAEAVEALWFHGMKALISLLAIHWRDAQVSGLAKLGDRLHSSSPFAGAWRWSPRSEETIFPRDRLWPDCPLDSVGVDLGAPVCQETLEDVAARDGIAKRCWLLPNSPTSHLRGHLKFDFAHLLLIEVIAGNSI